jgi:FkbM family methyltransferase
MTALPRFSNSAGIDLVDLGDFRAFMLVEDNLYKICVDPAHKRYPIDRHYRDIAQHGHQLSQVDRQSIHTERDPRFGVHIVLEHLIARGLSPTFLDVGSFVGDVGIRFGNFFRTLGFAGQVHCFDPTISGDLVPYNIRLNGLGDYVQHWPVAVSHVVGFMTFFQRAGHSDSSSAVVDASSTVNAIVPSLRLSEFIRTHGITDAFIKLDTENLERLILADVREHLNATASAVGFEFHVDQRDMWPLLTDLLSTHALFDIGYLPNPFCFTEIVNIEPFLHACAARPYRYTDVLAISRRTPALDVLLQRLRGLDCRPVQYSLVYPASDRRSLG